MKTTTKKFKLSSVLKMVIVIALISFSFKANAQVPCNANFTYVVNGNQVAFTNASTPSGNYYYNWTFGNSGTSNQQNPLHTFANPGWYYICLYIADSLNNCFDTYCDTIYVDSSQGPCNADFTYVVSGNQVTFTNTSTTQNNWYWSSWDFGHSNGSSFQQNPVHTFPGAGTYNVCLIINDSLCTDTVCKSITVGGATGPCNADFTYTIGANGQVSFTNTSTTPTNPFWSSWSFGDGNWSTTKHPSNTYASNGTYTVCLAIWDSICSDSICKTITIGPNGINEINSISVVDVYPNPTNSTTTINYSINESVKVEVSVIDVLGKTISVLESQNKPAGKHTLIWNAETVSAGIYMLSIKTPDKQIAKKIIVK